MDKDELLEYMPQLAKPGAEWFPECPSESGDWMPWCDDDNAEDEDGGWRAEWRGLGYINQDGEILVQEWSCDTEGDMDYGDSYPLEAEQRACDDLRSYVKERNIAYTEWVIENNGNDPLGKYGCSRSRYVKRKVWAKFRREGDLAIPDDWYTEENGVRIEQDPRARHFLGFNDEEDEDNEWGFFEWKGVAEFNGRNPGEWNEYEMAGYEPVPEEEVRASVLDAARRYLEQEKV